MQPHSYTHTYTYIMHEYNLKKFLIFIILNLSFILLSNNKQLRVEQICPKMFNKVICFMHYTALELSFSNFFWSFNQYQPIDHINQSININQLITSTNRPISTT